MTIDQEELTDLLLHLEIFANSTVRMIMDTTEEVVILTTATVDVAADLALRNLDIEILEDIAREAPAQERNKPMKMHPFRYLEEYLMISPMFRLF